MTVLGVEGNIANFASVCTADVLWERILGLNIEAVSGELRHGDDEGICR